MKFYLIAGERSGDLHGGNLIRQLKEREPKANFRGFGGDFMREAGMQIVVHYRELAFMGLAEVLVNLRTISKKIDQCKKDIISYKPDVVVLIDYAGFNMRIAQFARQRGIKVFWYISPKVWAWNQNRALKLKANVDRMFAILPFEKDFFKKFGWDVDYVGNPVLDAIKSHRATPDFKTGLVRNPDDAIVALLPGSRRQELKKIIPVMTGIALKLPELQFVVAAVSNLSRDLYQDMRQLSNVKLVDDASYDLLSVADAAVVTSGTATLETALFKVPQVVVYKTSRLTYAIGKLLIKVPFISLVNLIAGRQVVKELIQQQASVGDVTEELTRVLKDSEYRRRMLNDYDEIIRILDTGSASANTARLMLEYLRK